MRVYPVVGQFKTGYTFGVPTSYSDFHLGYDFVQKLGSPIIAPEDGEVVYVGSGTQGGKTIHLRGDSGSLTRYLHLDHIIVAKGERVEAGQQIGLMGSTGSLSTGSHLHFDVWTNGKIDLKKRTGLVDPIIWLNEDNMWYKVDVIKAFWKILVLFGHPEINDKDIEIHSKAKTPDIFVSGVVAYLKNWLAENGSLSAFKQKLIDFIQK